MCNVQLQQPCVRVNLELNGGGLRVYELRKLEALLINTERDPKVLVALLGPDIEERLVRLLNVVLVLPRVLKDSVLEGDKVGEVVALGALLEMAYQVRLGQVTRQAVEYALVQLENLWEAVAEHEQLSRPLPVPSLAFVRRRLGNGAGHRRAGEQARLPSV